MTRLMLALGFVGVLASSSAIAGGSDEKLVTFVGIEVGGDFGIKECPAMKSQYTNRVYDFYSENRPCWVDFEPGHHGPVKDGDLLEVRTATNPPSGVNKIFIKVINGKVSYVDAWTDGFVNQVPLYAALVEKFGKASTLEKSKVKAGSGAEFERILATWEGPKVTFTGVGSSIDEGLIQVYSEEGYKNEMEEIKKRKGSF